MRRFPLAGVASTTAFFACLVMAQPAAGQDLTVSSIEINQAVQYGSTMLIGNNTTIVRVKIGTGGATIGNVDAALRMAVNNVPVSGPPIFSINGPITAVPSPDSNQINQTLNFLVLPPVSSDVDFTVEVNPSRTVAETNYNNNTLTVANRVFICRGVPELPYVPINYTPNGAGLPPANLIEPGIGDGFVRSIYTTEWNYHKSPLPPLTWSTSINTSSAAMHNTLNDIRTNQLPAAGQPQAGVIYGWLPGNPFSGNGQANSIPGTSAFGNSDSTRHQRTCAHELGHCFGLQHNSSLINTIGFDEEHHLKDTQNLPQVFPTNKNDIMVAGLITNQAWVNSNSYNVVLNDSRLACGVGDEEQGVPPVPVMRVSGVIVHDTRELRLDPVTRIQRGHISVNNPEGDITIQALNAQGQAIWSVGYRTDTARESCELAPDGRPVLHAEGSFHVLIPMTVGGQSIQEVRVVDSATQNMLANVRRSPNAPTVAFGAVQMLEMQPHFVQGPPRFEHRLAGRTRLRWSAADADGDALSSTVIYTPDGGESWYPVAVNLTGDSFDFDSSDLPASEGNLGRFAVSVTDGLNVADAESNPVAFGAGTPPETYLLTPNTGSTYPQRAPIAFHGTSWDREDKLLNGSAMTWTSSIDGPIGTGRLFIKSDLSVGTHIITLTGTDTDVQASSKQITLTITPRIVITTDCNDNFVLDLVDIQNGTSQDSNSNGIPDECENSCPADITGNGAVNVDDLLAVIAAWGTVGPVPADVTGNAMVDVDDLLAVINAWGNCP